MCQSTDALRVALAPGRASSFLNRGFRDHLWSRWTEAGPLTDMTSSTSVWRQKLDILFLALHCVLTVKLNAEI